jgi:hypothetical protein
MDFKQLKLVELNSEELVNIDGGGASWLKKFSFYGVLWELANNWDAIKAGASDGWNGTYNNKF